VIAPARARRPGAERLEEIEPAADVAGCPFCAGRESATPPESFAIGPPGRAADAPGWWVRVVPNKFPALVADPPEPERDAHPDLFTAQPALGAHEVIVNAPDPVTNLAELRTEQVVLAVEAWRERMRAHADAACRHLIVNERREAGASLPHTHAQLYALPFVPAAIARERERAGSYAERTAGAGAPEIAR